MRREFVFATVLAAALSVGLSAQSGTGQSGQAGQGGTMAQGSYGGEKQAKDTKSQNVTLTGCIQSGNPSAPSAAGTSGTSGSYGSTGSATSGSDTMGTAASRSNASRSSADQFVLTNVTGAPASLSATDRVTLSGKEKDLQKHVGHKVEITGKWENGSAPSSSSSAGSSTSSTAGTSGSSSNGTLKVNSVKMIAESCSGQ